MWQWRHKVAEVFVQFEWLKNIYDYSKENCYDKAIFTVGAGHKKSLIEKIHEYEKKEKFKLNWSFYE